MSYVSAIALAAGRGVRLSRPDSFIAGGGIPTRISKMIRSGKLSKPLVQINLKPVIIYGLATLSKHPDIRDIVVVANTKNLKEITSKIRQYHIKKIRDIVLGGERRQDSVFNGLKAIDVKTDLVLVHDASRPFITQKIVSTAIKEAKKSGAAIVGVPVKATIKTVVRRPSSIVHRYAVKNTLNRKNLWEIQTPQVFKKDLILKAYKKFGKCDVTDDAMLVEKLGTKVSVVLGSYHNIKITTPEDLILAETIARYKL